VEHSPVPNDFFPMLPFCRHGHLKGR
jgi:hypothetical protein